MLRAWLRASAIRAHASRRPLAAPRWNARSTSSVSRPPTLNPEDIYVNPAQNRYLIHSHGEVGEPQWGPEVVEMEAARGFFENGDDVDGYIADTEESCLLDGDSVLTWRNSVTGEITPIRQIQTYDHPTYPPRRPTWVDDSQWEEYSRTPLGDRADTGDILHSDMKLYRRSLMSYCMRSQGVQFPEVAKMLHPPGVSFEGWETNEFSTGQRYLRGWYDEPRAQGCIWLSVFEPPLRTQSRFIDEVSIILDIDMNVLLWKNRHLGCESRRIRLATGPQSESFGMEAPGITEYWPDAWE